VWQEGLTANGLPRVRKFGGNVLVEVNTAVRKLAELSSLLDLCTAKIQSASAISLSWVRIPCAQVISVPRQREIHLILISLLTMRAFSFFIWFFCPWAMGCE
jgi:hypothetical protein